MKKLSLLFFWLLALMITLEACTNENEETPAPSITNLSPTEFTLAIGDTETLIITGANFGTNHSIVTVTLGGSSLKVQNISNTHMEANVTASASSGTVTVTVNGKSITSSQSITINQAPVISDFIPKSGGPGTEVTITGSNFTADAEVTFANDQIATVQFVSATELKTTVPVDAKTGKIIVNIGNAGVETTIDFEVVKIPDVTTTSVTEVTETTATSGGNITDDGGVTVTSRGVCWSTTEEPTINDNKTEDGTGADSFTSSLTDLEPKTTYFVRAYATNSIGTGYGIAIPFTTMVNYGSFTDTRDGKVYQTVVIGNQQWMAENLAYESSSGNYWAYDNDNFNIETYGYLYDWETALNVCPIGWHLPNDEEWTELTDYLGGTSVAGGKLKETGTVHWLSPNNGATNETGFTALPGGSHIYDATLYTIKGSGYWWCATEYDTEKSWYRSMHYLESNLGRKNDYKMIGFSVRCIKD